LVLANLGEIQLRMLSEMLSPLCRYEQSLNPLDSSYQAIEVMLV
jgi:hypothetical protein